MDKNFIWGVATAATQIEGGAQEGGRGLSIWDAFSRIPGNIAGGDTPEIACDSFHKWQDDLRLMKELGVNSYRYSVSWSRVLPEGKGKVNREGLDYYKRLTEALLENDIAPNVTLYHWDLPYELHRLGGWLNRDVTDWFADYASIVFEALPDVPFFATHNEPIATYVGYAKKIFAPGFGREDYGRIANHNILLSHGKAVERFRAAGCKGQIGIVVDVWNRVPADPDLPADVELAKRENLLAHGNYLIPVFKGEYDPLYLAYLDEQGITLPVKEGDMKLISQPLDFYGLNCYNRVMVSSQNADIIKVLKKNGGNFLQDGQTYYPDAIYDAVKIVKSDYGVNIPIYITENGVGLEQEPLKDGVIQDDDRITLLKSSFAALEKLRAEGYDVRGYYLWSLLDNWEWTRGYGCHYGLYTIDRRPKKSAAFYRDYIAEQRK